MGEVVPWLAPYLKTAPQHAGEATALIKSLVLHVERHRDILHRVDAWLAPTPSGGAPKSRVDCYKVTYEPPASYRPPYPVPLRVGDVLCYNFSYLPILTHVMIYVGAGYVVHYRPHLIFSKESQEVTFEHIDEFTPSQRSRMYVCPRNGYTRLPRYRVAIRALATVGTYADLDGDINCQHIIERILGNESFSVGVPRVAAGMTAVTACIAAVIALLILNRSRAHR